MYVFKGLDGPASENLTDTGSGNASRYRERDEKIRFARYILPCSCMFQTIGFAKNCDLMRLSTSS